jgi:hypothetical protein
LGEDDGDLEELTQPPSGPISGWIGTPDPRKYAPGTTYLGPSELQAEIEAGNVVALEDWGKALDDLEPWERHMLSQALAADFAKYRCRLVKCMRKSSPVQSWNPLLSVPGPVCFPQGQV